MHVLEGHSWGTCEHVANILESVVQSYEKEGVEGARYVSLNYFTGKIGTANQKGISQVWNRASLGQITSIVKQALKELEGSTSSENLKLSRKILNNYAVIICEMESKPRGGWSKFISSHGNQIADAKRCLQDYAIDIGQVKISHEKIKRVNLVKEDYHQALLKKGVISDDLHALIPTKVDKKVETFNDWGVLFDILEKRYSKGKFAHREKHDQVIKMREDFMGKLTKIFPKTLNYGLEETDEVYLKRLDQLHLYNR